jgi:hypothetical protein
MSITSLIRGPLVVGLLVGGVHVRARASSLCSGSGLCGSLALTWGADGCEPTWLGSVNIRKEEWGVERPRIVFMSRQRPSSFFS